MTLTKQQIMSSAKLAHALRFYLQANGVQVPDGHFIAVGQGSIDTEKQILAIEYSFMKPVDLGEEDENDYDVN